jgi:hypothetical protein
MESKLVLSCSECLARHSEYLDGVMDSATAELWRAHIAGCAHCARYDRVLRRGLKTLTAQPFVELDPTFTSELHRRLAFEDRRLATRPITSMAAASVAVAAMLAFAAWLPVMLLTSSPEQQVAGAPASQVASEIAWHGESAVETRAPSHVHQARRIVWPANNHHVIEAKYTPVILESPIAPLSYARTVSLGTE